MDRAGYGERLNTIEPPLPLAFFDPSDRTVEKTSIASLLGEHLLGMCQPGGVAMSRKDLVIAPALEAALILVVAGAGWLASSPLVFTSLGPTAFELIETPNRPSAKPYNVIVGHLIGVLAGFAALWITNAWSVPGIASHTVALPRVAAATISALLTVLVTLMVHATQPAALSTTLLVALGTMQRWQDGFFIMASVLILVFLGEPLRRWRSREKPRD